VGKNLVQRLDIGTPEHGEGNLGRPTGVGVGHGGGASSARYAAGTSSWRSGDQLTELGERSGPRFLEHPADADGSGAALLAGSGTRRVQRALRPMAINVRTTLDDDIDGAHQAPGPLGEEPLVMIGLVPGSR